MPLDPGQWRRVLPPVVFDPKSCRRDRRFETQDFAALRSSLQFVTKDQFGPEAEVL
jgi:hypothetical protein